MDRSFLRRAVVAAAAVGAPIAAHAQDAGPSPKDEEVLFAADSWTFDGKSDVTRFKGLRITQGDWEIRADEAVASALDFNEGNEWRLTGHVRIAVGEAVIEADRAVFTFKNDRLAAGELAGSPARFKDRNADGSSPAEGGADNLSYDYDARTVRLADNAWVNKGRYEIQGCDLIYDFSDEQRITSGSADCGIRMRLLPEPDDASAAPPAAP
jgi:lipopolysaccharide transport protein LptA